MPCTLMRGCEQNAVNVENARDERLEMFGSAPRGFGGGYDGCTLLAVTGNSRVPILKRSRRTYAFGQNAICQSRSGSYAGQSGEEVRDIPLKR